MTLKQVFGAQQREFSYGWFTNEFSNTTSGGSSWAPIDNSVEFRRSFGRANKSHDRSV